MIGIISAETGISIQAGILSWKSDETLEYTLSSLTEKHFFELFDRTSVYFQEVRPQDISRAEKYQLNWIGSETNRHIGGGFYNLIKSIDSEYIFLLEDDLSLYSTSDDLRKSLVDGIELIKKGAIDLFGCRRDDFLKGNYTKYLKIHSLNNESFRQQPVKFSKRNPVYRIISSLLHPRQKYRMMCMAIWVEQNPHLIYPRYIEKLRGKYNNVYRVTGKPTIWFNPGLLARKEFLLRIYDYINRQTPGFDDFGRDLEDLVNITHRHWWLRQNIRIGFSTDVLISHNRKQDGGKVNFNPTISSAGKA